MKSKAIYNKIGENYNQYRTADNRISDVLIELLAVEKGAKIADIGAGTGNYALKLAEHGFEVYALEPSELMHEQRQVHPRIQWFKGVAEDAVFAENSLDGICSVLATHHFTSLEKAFTEIKNALKTNAHFVVFTADPRLTSKTCWFREYFDLFIQKAETTLPPNAEIIEILERIFENKAKITPFLIPHDIKDGFFYAAWQTPEKYLDPNFRKSISVFAQAPEALVNAQMDRLKTDLDNGNWDKQYNDVRHLTAYEGGYYFISIRK
jgi:ubiquinone/menaquinone biosynthesis C-methylase UbiE